MDSINLINNLINAVQGQPNSTQAQADGSLAPLEHFIDSLVKAENKAVQANTQAAIKKQQILEVYEQRIAFLSGMVHQAESELASLEGSSAALPASATNQQLLDAKMQEVVYWRTQLRQVIPPGSSL